MEEQLNPIDSYLAQLQQQKQRVEENLPQLVAGVNNIFGTSIQIPNGSPLNIGAEQATGGNQGRVNFAPGMNTPKVSPSGTSDFVKNILQSSMIPGAIPESEGYQRVRQVGFGSSANKNNFARYYNHPMYKKLGWNPFADNEAIYNANSTWLDDWSRASSQWGSLAYLGFKQTFGNWDDLFTLNTEGDTRYAREMNKMMSIANSSRGGLGGFATNLYANSAYTFGVIGEAVAEEIALWGATALTGGMLGEAALLRTGTLGKRLAKAGELSGNASKLAEAGQQADNLSDTLSGINTALNAVNKPSDAKKFWTGVGNFFNPLGETTSTLKNIKTGANGFDQLSDFAKSAKTFGAFFRDVRMLNTTLAESRLEGGMVENDVFDQLYAKWMEDHNGQAPTGKDADDIMAQAKTAGSTTTLANAPAIFFSNKIVFEKMLNGFKPFKDLKGSLGEMVINPANIGKPGKKVFEGFIDPSFYKAFYKKQHFKYAVNQFKPKNLMKNGLRYASANLAEGLQESYQEGISSAMKNYYLDTFASPERAGLAYAMQHVGKGFGEQFTGQGAETFLSGFLMGGMVQGPQKLLFQTAPQLASKGYTKAFEPELYKKQQEAKLAREAKQQELTNFLNEVQADPSKFYDTIYANMQSQKDFANLMNDAEAAGDEKEHKDAKNDSIFNHVSTLLDSGYIDLFTDQIQSFKELDDNALAEAFSYSDTMGEKDKYNKDVRSRLDSVLGKVNQIKGLYDKYSGITNPFNPRSDDPAEKMDYAGFETAKRMAIYNEYTFEQGIKRMSDMLKDATDSNLGNIPASALTMLFSQSPLMLMNIAPTSLEDIGKTRLDKEIDQLEEEAKTYAQGNAEQQKLGKQKETLAGQLRQFQADYQQYIDTYKNAKSSALSEERSKEYGEDVGLENRIVEGSNVQHTFKNGTTVTGVVTGKKGSKITIEYDLNGKKEKKTISIKSKKLQLLDGPQNAVDENAQATAIETSIEERRTAMGNSLRQYLATVSGLPVDSVQFDKIAGHMVDYAEVGEDTKLAMSVVNMLNNPGKFSLAAQAFSQGKKDAFQIAQTNLKKSLETYQKRMETNELLKDLYYKFNVFLLPEDIEKLLDNDIYPTAFYEMDVKTKEIRPISPASSKYTAILDFLGTESEKEGTTLKGRPILEQPQEVVVYPTMPIEKAPTLKEILEGLGLTPGQKTYTVPAGELIKFILNERLATPVERGVLQKLLTMVDPSTEIVISLTEGDAFSFKKETGIVIDPRFASRDYSQQTGKGDKLNVVRFGYMMANALTQKMVNDNLNDPQFQAAIDDVMSAVVEHVKVKPGDIRNIESIHAYAMQSREKFIAMALSSTEFQDLLSVISYKNQNTNLWKQIIKSIAALIKKIYKGKIAISDNALEEVLGIVSTKAAGQEIKSQAIKAVAKPSETKTTTKGKGVTYNTPFEEIEKDHPDLYKTIVLISNKDNPSRTPEEIAEWFKSEPVELDDIISEYNKINNLTLSEDELEAMVLKNTQKTEERKIALISKIETANEATLELLEKTYAAPSKLAKVGLSFSEFNKYIRTRRAQLASELPNFEELTNTHVLLMQDPEEYENEGMAMIIEAYDPDTQTITIQFGEDGEEETMTKQEYYGRVDRVMTQDEIADEEMETEPEPEEKEVSNTNAEASAEQEEAYYDDLDSKAGLNNKDEIENDLLNNLGCQ